MRLELNLLARVGTRAPRWKEKTYSCSNDTDIDIANMGHACLSSPPSFSSRYHGDLERLHKNASSL